MKTQDSSAPDKIRWFGVPARPAIVVFLALYTVGMLVYRAQETDERSREIQQLVGRPYADFAFYFGPPEKEEPDGEQGLILYYDDVGVEGDRFVEAPFRVYLNNRGRIYRIEFD